MSIEMASDEFGAEPRSPLSPPYSATPLGTKLPNSAHGNSDRAENRCLRATLCHPNSRFQPESTGIRARSRISRKPLWQAGNRLPEPEAPTGIEPV